MKKYIELKENHSATHLKIEVYYNLGGYNAFTGKSEPRGYYLSVSPVTLSHTDYGVTLESYTAFSGLKLCIKEVTRKSEKAARAAEEIAATRERDIIAAVCDKNGLEVTL